MLKNYDDWTHWMPFNSNQIIPKWPSYAPNDPQMTPLIHSHHPPYDPQMMPQRALFHLYVTCASAPVWQNQQVAFTHLINILGENAWRHSCHLLKKKARAWALISKGGYYKIVCSF